MVLLRHDLPAGSFASSTGGSRMLSAFFQRSALHLLLYDMTAQIVPPCSTPPLSAALFGCFPSPQMQGAEGCSLSFQKIAGSTTRHPEEASAFSDILQHTKTAPASVAETGAVRLLYGFLFALFKRPHHHLRGFLMAAWAGAKIAGRWESFFSLRVSPLQSFF